MKSYPLLLLALLATAHCASAPRWRTDSGTAAPPSSEEFDPRTLGEAPLLIEPVQRELKEREERAQTPAEPAPPAPDRAAAASTSVYRLQLLALSNKAMARQRRVELERALGVKVYLVARNEHSVLQAGQYPTRAQAAALKEQVAALGPDYADAYVVEVPAGAGSDSEAAPGPEPTFGWKVQIAQFLEHDKASRLVADAKKRLQRDDINVIFKEPYYKIEVGNYRTEAHAQAAAERIGEFYPLALKVRSQIFISQED